MKEANITPYRRFHNVLRSRYLTIAVMLAVLVAALIGLLFPQAGDVTPRQLAAWAKAYPVWAAVGRVLGANRVFSSWWFLLAAGLLFVNGSLCLVEQVDKAGRLTRRRGFVVGARMLQPTARKKIAVADLDVQSAVEVLEKTLSGAGLRVRKGTLRGEPALLAVASSWSQWGAVVFHAALLSLLASVLLVSLTQAEGNFRVVVGGGFTDKPGAYGRFVHGPLGPDSFGGWTVYFSKFDPLYKRGDFKPGPASSITVTTVDGGRHVHKALTRGEYFGVDGTNIFQNAPWGVAPILAVKDPSGKVRTGAIMMRKHTSSGKPPTDRFVVGQGVEGSIGMPQVVTSTKMKPRLKVILKKDGRTVISKYLGIKETARGGGFAVTYADFRYWSEFLAVRNPWLIMINVSFWLVLGGLSVMYLWPSTYAWALVRRQDGMSAVYMGGRREKFSADFAGLVERAKEDLEAAVSKERM